MKLIQKGKFSPTPKGLTLLPWIFFRKYNPTVYQNLVREGDPDPEAPVRPVYKPTIRARLTGWTKRFAETLFSFDVGQLLLSPGPVWSLNNPVQMEQTWQAIKDPYGVASFAGFVWAHQQTMKRLSVFRSLPLSLNNFIGMGVGMLVSSTLHELFIDTDLKACWFSDNEAACAAAEERWLSKDKYIGYTPELLALGAAATGSHAISSRVGRASLRIIPKEMAPSLIKALHGASFFSPLRMIMQVGNFTLFLYLHHLASPIIHSVWDPLNFKLLGLHLTEELKKDKPEFSRYIRSYDRNREEMEWLRNNTGRLLEERDNYINCIPLAQDFDELNMSMSGNHLYSPYDLPTILQKIYTCERRLNPSLIVETNYAFQKASDKLRLKGFENKTGQLESTPGPIC